MILINLKKNEFGVNKSLEKLKFFEKIIKN